MESLIGTLITGEMTSTTLLLLFIIALLTKRFVPWWIYESMEERLKHYEKEAPELIKDVQRLIDTMDGDVEEVESLRTRRIPRRPYGNSRNKSKKGDSDDSFRNSS